MMKYKLYKFLLTANILALLLLTGGISQAFDTSVLIVPKEAERAAQEGLQRFLDVISDQKPEEFNFRSPGELKRQREALHSEFLLPLRIRYFAAWQRDESCSFVQCDGVLGT